MATRACAFCGFYGKLTGEHLFGDWLTRIGLSSERAPHFAGPLNRSPRNLGTPPSFSMKVRNVCGTCNNGWMSRLETVAARVLTSPVLGRPAVIDVVDQPFIAVWVQKTALVAMLVSSAQDRAGGYGLPAEEYHSLFELRDRAMPLPQTEIWLGRYRGKYRKSSVQVTPMVVKVDELPEPERPQAYVMTVTIGEVLLQGVRFASPALQLSLAPEQGLARIWPTTGPVTWPCGVPIDDESIAALCKGLNLRSAHPGVTFSPWRPSTDLEVSTVKGKWRRMPVPCGRHFVSYPDVLVGEARSRIFYAFVISCECGKAYLLKTEPDGVHIRSEGEESIMQAVFDDLPGDPLILQNESESFTCKRLAALPMSRR
jgi:hypothetical protein